MIPKPATVAMLGGWRATVFALATVVALTATGVQTERLHYQEGRNAKLAAALGKAQVDAQIQARKAEQEKAQAIAAIADQYEQDKANAQKAADRTIADLRAGNLRLQNRWRGCVPGTPASPGEPDAAAADREQGAADIVRAAAEADAQIRALQDIVKADRK